METYRAGSWDIEVFHGNYMKTDELSALGARLGIKIPDIVTKSYVCFKNSESKVAYRIDPEGALNMCSLSLRMQKLQTEGELYYDHINVIPEPVRVHHSGSWANKTLPKDSLFNEADSLQIQAKEFDPGCDWTYSSPYKGELLQIDLSPQIDLKFRETNENIPLEMLGVDNPILWSTDILLYEDELNDNGHSRFNFRIRCMEDCFFALIRSYLRVDHVIVRIIDTQIFHKFSERKILREFQLKEADFDALRSSGFDISPQWLIDPYQSDIVYQFLPLKFSFKDYLEY
ncbi:unnamed protein product [Blepharisma stoltei]|uniref:TIP41-like protein n=1 Tax=Blepharisma stoltei TaxID=1481888 RepID=A0AAU9K2R0_9CILI|nr:unnamed protein product [Blepharisma stoltei]